MFEACRDYRIQGKFIHYFPGGKKINLVCKIRYFIFCKRVVQFVFQVTFTMYVRVSGLLTPNSTFVWFTKMSVYLFPTAQLLQVTQRHDVYFALFPIRVWQAQALESHTSTVIEVWNVISVRIATLLLPGCWYVLSPTYFPMCFV